jgi:Calcineurin-like phosphoesterase
MGVGLSVRAVVRALLLGAIGAGAIGAAQAGCSSGRSAAGDPGAADGDTGTIGLALSLPGGALFDSVTYTLLDGAGNLVALPGAPNPGTISLAHSQSIQFQLGGVPAGSGDSITLTGSTSDGGSCQGTATGITVAPRVTEAVHVQLLCSLPGPDAGNLLVTAVPAFCGTWTSLSSGSTGSEAYVGESVTLTATATGPAPDSLGYSWSQSTTDGGVVGVLSTAQDEAAGPTDTISYLCTAPGTATITVVVDDGPVPDGGACPTSQSTLSTTVVCDPYPAGQVQAAWVELGAGGSAIARAITAVPGCPTIAIDGASQAMGLRIGAGTEPLRSTTSTSLGPQFSKPSVFPVNACELALPAGTTSAVVAGHVLPLPNPNPTKMVVLGDSGCRMKAGSPPQFQGCNDPTQYPFQQLATLAASLRPDVVLHLGDYQYRENECPPNQANCAGSPWGYGWDTWEADFFGPAANLLAAAPWIVTRGNHEQCTRAGQGWYRFLDTNPYSEAQSCNSAANDAVLQPTGVLVGGAYNDPYAVPLGPSSQVIVFDSNNVGASAVTSGGSSNFITYQNELTAAGALATSKSVFNIWSNHHPLLGFAPNAGAPPSPGNLDVLSVMAATYPGTYYPPNINLALHGHTHLFEAIDFTSTSYPATIVSGNAGTLLDIALPDPFPTATVHPDPAGNVTVSTISDSAGFGFLFMEYTGGVWVITEYRLDGSVRSVCTAQVSGQMTCTVNGYVN